MAKRKGTIDNVRAALDSAAKALDEADPREVARVISLARCGAGTVMMMAPRLAARGWTGIPDESPSTRMAMRSLGVRDVAIGMGTLFALSHDTPVRGWVEAGMLSDTVDSLNGAVTLAHVAKVRSLLWIAMSGLAALVGYRISLTIDE